jgi:hypothetical protein
MNMGLLGPVSGPRLARSGRAELCISDLYSFAPPSQKNCTVSLEIPPNNNHNQNKYASLLVLPRAGETDSYVASCNCQICATQEFKVQSYRMTIYVHLIPRTEDK